MLSPDYYIIEKFAQCSNQNDLANCFQKFRQKFFKKAWRLTDVMYYITETADFFPKEGNVSLAIFSQYGFFNRNEEEKIYG